MLSTKFHISLNESQRYKHVPEQPNGSELPLLDEAEVDVDELDEAEDDAEVEVEVEVDVLDVVTGQQAWMMK